MAYVYGKVAYTRSLGNASASIDVNMPEHESGDLLIVCASYDSNTQFYPVAGSWAEPVSTESVGSIGGSRSKVYSLVASSDTESLTLSGVSGTWVIFALCIREHDGIDAADFIAINTSVFERDCPSVTTTVDGALLIRFIGGFLTSTNGYFLDADELLELGYLQEGGNACLAIDVQASAGVAPARTFRFDTSYRGHSYTIAIKNAVGGTVQPMPNQIYEYLRYAGLYGSNNNPAVTFASLYSIATTIGGTPVLDVASSKGTSGSFPLGTRNNNADQVTYNTTANTRQWVGEVYDVALDLSAGEQVYHLTSANITSQVGPDGMGIIIVDGSGNWEIYNIVAANINVFYSIMAGKESTPVFLSGAVDWSDIAKIGFVRQRSSSSAATSVTHNSGPLIKINPIRLVGGSPTYWLDNDYINLCLRQLDAWYVGNLQGISQLAARTSIEVGDGSTPTYFKASGKSFEFEKRYNRTSSPEWFAGENALRFTVNASASDVIDFSGALFVTQLKQLFEFAVTTSALATYRTSGLTLSGYQVIWQAAVPANNITFSSCHDIDGGAAQFGGCSVSASQSASAALLLANGGAFTDGTIEKGAETYAIELSDAGSYDLSGSVFTGYTTDLHISAVSGTVTINLDPSDDVPTYTSDGATVVIDNAVTVDVTFTIKDQETGALVEGAVVYLEAESGGSLSAGDVILSATTAADGIATVSFSISGGPQPFRGRVRKSSATPFYRNYPLSGSITSAGYSNTVLLVRED